MGPCLAEDIKLSSCWDAVQYFYVILSLLFSFSFFDVFVFLGVILHLTFAFRGWWWL